LVREDKLATRVVPRRSISFLSALILFSTVTELWKSLKSLSFGKRGLPQISGMVYARNHPVFPISIEQRGSCLPSTKTPSKSCAVRMVQHPSATKTEKRNAQIIRRNLIVFLHRGFSSAKYPFAREVPAAV
jgi:hypothetical protein